MNKNSFERTVSISDYVENPDGHIDSLVEAQMKQLGLQISKLSLCTDYQFGSPGPEQRPKCNYCGSRLKSDKCSRCGAPAP